MTHLKRVEAGRIGQSDKSNYFIVLLKELKASVGLLKFAKVCQINIIYDGKFSSKFPVCKGNLGENPQKCR